MYDTDGFCGPFVQSLLRGRPNTGTFDCPAKLTALRSCQKFGSGKQGYAMLCHTNGSALAGEGRVAVKCSTRTDKPAQAVHEAVVACRLRLLPQFNVTDGFVWILDFAWCDEQQTKDFLERIQVHDGRLVRRSTHRTFIAYQLAERTPRGKLPASYIFEMVYAILVAFETFRVGVRDLQQKHLYCMHVDYARVYTVEGLSCMFQSAVMLKLIDLGAYGVSGGTTPADLLGLSNYFHLFRTPALLTSDAWDLYLWTKDPQNFGKDGFRESLHKLVARVLQYNQGEYRYPLANGTTAAKIRHFRPLTPTERNAVFAAHPYAAHEVRNVKFE